MPLLTDALNGLKVYDATYQSLKDPFFLARKKDFEKNFKEAVQSNPKLNKIYGNIWTQIAENRQEASIYAKEIFALTISSTYSPKYLFIAKDLVKLAEQLKLAEEKREVAYKNDKLDSLIQNIFPKVFDKNLEDKKLILQLNVLMNNLASDNQLLQIMTDGKTGNEAITNLLAKSKITTKENVITLAKSGADAILDSDDPFINFVLSSRERLAEMDTKNKALEDADVINNQLLGEALYKVYADAIPPDADTCSRFVVDS